MSATTISVPALVRVKPNALDRLGIYLARAGHFHVAILQSSGLKSELLQRALDGLVAEGITVDFQADVADASFEQAAGHLARLSSATQAIVGLGGGKALDTAKYVAFLADRTYYAVPTSLSNDGFCSPQSSLTLAGRRRSLAARLPAGVIIDTDVCLQAPLSLWWSGVGDLVAKITAIQDWKSAFHAKGEVVNDLAALLSDATVRQFMARPSRDHEGIQLLGTSLLLNGIAMEIGGSSRPASGSEHLISHALDQRSQRPRLHGLQVGTATYLAAHLQGLRADEVGQVLDQTRFWDGIRSDPFSRAEWLDAVQVAPSMKPNFYTVLSERNCVPEVQNLIDSDPFLKGCFVA
jgi:glycerol-1-phosphate dehydrogenase [NAD(P)+]